MSKRKKYEPRLPNADDKQHHLASEPVRDGQALLLPLSAIKITTNIRDSTEGVTELAASIAQHSLLQPLTVRKASDGTFELIAGHRRYLALQELGRAEAPCRIQNVTDAEARVLQVIENLVRENLSGWETCKAVHGLLPLFGTHARVAETLGKDRSYVTKCMAVVEAGLDGERVHQLPLRELFQLAAASKAKSSSDTKAGHAPEREAADKPSRKLSGPIADGRFTDPVKFRETKTGWTLRVAWDPVRVPDDARKRLIATLETVLAKLKHGGD